MADLFTIDGVPLDPITDDFVALRFSERFGTIPSLTLQRRGIALPGLPDPWIGKEATWRHNGTLTFTGDVVSATPSYTGIGWVITYQCLGIRNRLDWFPHTDGTSGIDTSQFNLTLEDPDYNAAKAGRTVGEILNAALTMEANAHLIHTHGLGGYTSLAPPTLPAATLADLAAMTVIPPRPVYFTGEKLGAAIDGFLQQNAPNHRFWIQPDGVFRFMDLRTFTPQTLTMGTDPIEPTELSRDVGDCFQRVVVRGQPIAIMGVLKQSLGQITQNFAHDGLTNAQAISAWSPSQFRQAGTAQNVGTCTCPSTTTVTVTSTNASAAWASNFWDQTHGQGVINLYSTTVPGVTQLWSSRIISNTSLTAGGTSTLTIDSPLPHTNYGHYTISGLSTGGSVVWTQYQIADSSLWPKVVKQSTYPQPFVSPGNGGATLISASLGVVLWSSNGSPPYNSFPLAFTYNPTTGNVRFISPTYFTANNAAPADIWLALPLQTNPNQAIEPPDLAGVPQYSGTSYTVDGLTKTLTVDAPYWRDPGQLAQIQAYASNLLDSVNNATCEGGVTYYGFFTDAMTFGLALNIAGNDGNGAYTTGWEGLSLAVIGVDLDWPENEGIDYRTTMHCSNRRQALSASMFMHPEQQLGAIGTSGDLFNPFAIYQPEMMRESQGNYREAAEAARAGKLSPGGLSTGNDTGLGASGFTMADILRAGADNGSGVHDPASNTSRRPATLKPREEREAAAAARSERDKDRNDQVREADQKHQDDRRAKIRQTNEDNDAKRQAKNDEIRAAEGNRLVGMRALGDTTPRLPKDPAERERIADLGNHPTDTWSHKDRGVKQPEAPNKRIANLGRHEAAPADERIKNLGRHQPKPPSERIKNLGKHPTDVSAYKDLGVSRPEDPAKAKRISKLGLPDKDEE
ncbi:hypothetical protein [Singulisphaera acidiphila]|uniref:Uncharacterized protein n=1 Tax=Singulisphaera acidiphila (strain ATCC BAA-1392 / DSM 18658 / VKM B-2454 / MOB10) TaxID=886293 RepID=L0DIB9_SINAD|nr:hypothetical protein [Singulisphaera acidiphila]AGA28376.1 hypothetical protein Sinac_4169 [Singulisphaera acidiphila DSM 18658]